MAPGESGYATRKVALEQALLAAGDRLPSTLVRAGAVDGRHGPPCGVSRTSCSGRGTGGPCGCSRTVTAFPGLVGPYAFLFGYAAEDAWLAAGKPVAPRDGTP